MADHTLFDGAVGRHRDNGLLLETHSRLGHSEDENSQIRGSSVIVFSWGPPMDFALVKPPKGKHPWNTEKDDYEYHIRLVVPCEAACSNRRYPRVSLWLSRAHVLMARQPRLRHGLRAGPARRRGPLPRGVVQAVRDEAGRERARCADGAHRTGDFAACSARGHAAPPACSWSSVCRGAVAFAFRWLSKQHYFYCDAEGEKRHALAPTPEILAAAAVREEAREKKKAIEEAKAERAGAAVAANAGRLRPRVGSF